MVLITSEVLLAGIIMEELRSEQNYQSISFDGIIKKLKTLMQEGKTTINKDLLGDAIKKKLSS